MAQFLHFAGNAFISPDILFGELNNEVLGGLAFPGTTRLLGGVVVGPFLLLHSSVPGQEGFRFHNAHDVTQSVLDSHPVLDQDSSFHLREPDPFAEFAAQDLVLLPEIIILSSKVPAEDLLNLGNEGLGRGLEILFHTVIHT